MTNTENELEKLLSPLAKLLGEDMEKDIKKSIGDLVVSRVEDNINNYGCYLFYPDDYLETVEEAFDSVKSKIKKIYKDTALEQAEKAVEIFKRNTESAMALNPKILTWEQQNQFKDFLGKGGYGLDQNRRNEIVVEMKRIYES